VNIPSSSKPYPLLNLNIVSVLQEARDLERRGWSSRSGRTHKLYDFVLVLDRAHECSSGKNLIGIMAVPTCHARYDPGQTLSAFKLYY
jgi:hypothetical protein